MSHRCVISKVSCQNGNRVSHANNKTKHLFKANIQTKRIYVPSKKSFVRLKISSRIIRTIDKLGLEGTLKKYNLKLADLM